MFRMAMVASAVILATGTASAQSNKLMLFGGKDHVYLGCLNCNAIAVDSVCSQVGASGSTLSSDSIWNPYGRFGSQYQAESPWNRYATSGAPVVVDSFGHFYGYFSANPYYPNRTRLSALESLLDLAHESEKIGRAHV